MDIEAEGQGKPGILTIAGAVTVQRMEELKALLVDAMARADRVVIDLSQVTEVDLCGLQLLCSARRTAVQFHKSLAFAGPKPDALLRAAEEAGVCVRSGCGMDERGRCTWKGGLD